MTLVPPTLDPQRRAADPYLSAFVTANAGSGKTKTLIDRVARLLLAGAAPETILCVTYTKAAAAEMQRRLYDLLGGWSVLDDKPLADALGELEGRLPLSYDDEGLSKARALFAHALETPGGLKIQTIHAFCEKLLRRFPLEAGLPPGFKVMDDPAAAAVADAARKAVARHAMTSVGSVAQAYARFSIALDFKAFQSMFVGFEAQRGKLATYFEAQGGMAGAETNVWAACGFDGSIDPQSLEQEWLASFNPRLWRKCAEILAAGGKTDQNIATKMRAVSNNPSVADALVALFTGDGEGTPAKHIATTKTLSSNEGLRLALLTEQDQLEALRERIRAANIAEDTLCALTLAEAYLAAYRLEKAFSGGLDFADLIEKTAQLTAHAPQAAWVLYKLDGGFNHILVDEAQDTAPDQWKIVRALTGEFFSGAGAGGPTNGLERNLFVVGDEKQSIYSFQGAAPEILAQEFAFHRDRAKGAGHTFVPVPLLSSWRSTPQILSFVDRVFAPPALAQAIVPRRGEDGEAEPIHHDAVRGDQGCVDLWDLIRAEKGEVREAWNAPMDAVTEASADRILAERIAAEIKDLVARGDQVLDKDTRNPRPATFGDVLILVRRRKTLFEEILRALKRGGVPVAGADRLALTEHILFDDLLALARFVQFPSDELTLAALLRSPFCTVSDQSLYELSHGRKENLWTCLARRAGEQQAWAEAYGLLSQVQALGRSHRPFEFYARALSLRDAKGQTQKSRLLLRLGAEAQDALDEYLSQVLAAEGRGIEDLESLAAALVTLNIVVKREMEAARHEVRVMTAHGAKGLEAPIVFLPETTLASSGRGSLLLPTQSGGFLWSSKKSLDCKAASEARAWRDNKEEDETYRLLYVALTRARDRLVLCGRMSSTAKEENIAGWWDAMRTAFEHPDLTAEITRKAADGFGFFRYGPDPVQGHATTVTNTVSTALPIWTATDPTIEAHARYASPSDLGEGSLRAAASPLSGPPGLGRFRRGDLIHRLLQILPDLPADSWATAAERVLAREPDLTPPQCQEMISAALGVLEDDQFAEVFGPGSRAEVAVAGTGARLPDGLNISGRLDRLVVLPERVLVVDFKTNRPSPAAIEDADPAYLRQMALYVGVLSEVFPDRLIEAALVWTDGPKLMPIPEILIARTLAELVRDG